MSTSVSNFNGTDSNMQKDKETNAISRRYFVQSVCIVALLTLISWLVSTFVGIGGLTAPVAVASVFMLIMEGADAYIWGRVRKASEGSLPTFYTAISGFRMLLALATLVGCFLVVGRDAMREYCLVFVCYYLAMVAHHSVFFARISNSHTSCDKENK